jgi:hypothetical protein
MTSATKMPTTVRYCFTQRLAVSARDAFDWCTAFDPDDNALTGYNNAQRQITRIADGSIILKDTFHTPASIIKKQNLVSYYFQKKEGNHHHKNCLEINPSLPDTLALFQFKVSKVSSYALLDRDFF